MKGGIVKNLNNNIKPIIYNDYCLNYKQIKELYKLIGKKIDSINNGG